MPNNPKSTHLNFDSDTYGLKKYIHLLTTYSR